MQRTINNLPWAVREGKTFRIAGRNGEWKYFRGHKRPITLRTPQKFHVIARTQTPKGRILVREFIRVRKYRIADDGMVLDRLRSGRLRIEASTARVFSLVESMGEWRELVQYEDGKGRYLFVRIYAGDERKKIAVHRLQIMQDIDDEIPAGFDVDHRDKDYRNNSLANLRLLRAETNRCTNLSQEPF